MRANFSLNFTWSSFRKSLHLSILSCSCSLPTMSVNAITTNKENMPSVNTAARGSPADNDAVRGSPAENDTVEKGFAISIHLLYTLLYRKFIKLLYNLFVLRLLAVPFQALLQLPSVQLPSVARLPTPTPSVARLQYMVSRPQRISASQGKIQRIQRCAICCTIPKRRRLQPSRRKIR